MSTIAFIFCKKKYFCLQGGRAGVALTSFCSAKFPSGFVIFWEFLHLLPPRGNSKYVTMSNLLHVKEIKITTVF